MNFEVVLYKIFKRNHNEEYGKTTFEENILQRA